MLPLKKWESNKVNTFAENTQSDLSCYNYDTVLLSPTGEALGVSLEVVNESARTVTPRFYLCEKQTFAAQSMRMVHTGNVLLGTGDCVPAQTTQTITKVLSIPPDLAPTFFNCCLMKLEYRLKVCCPTYAST